ncbi:MULTISPECIES: hypothetical protein [unclassified Streptomyces]|uniref:hypothetical protein n=1 Tax=unclassified Streptomyces TaxID=2593676 RepID=UPI0022B67391|nr:MULTISPECIES: hypothetical protein [unclassified Streptomyces]MCZ7414934.1 hypothetical protein [Streptomyces sp. WMMC897]MCZ7431877.1 hypothetical protein [Streptomyces sp. WMMC1477]
MKARAAALALMSILLTACSVIEGSGAGEPEINVNMQEAADQADAILDETLNAIKPEVEWVHFQGSHQGCTDWKNGETGTGAVSRRRAVVTVISDQRRGNFIGSVEDYWKKRGYTILDVVNRDQNPAIYAETPEGFRVRILFGAYGQAHFKASTPCAIESEVSDVDWTRSEDAVPSVKSEYWSAGAD